MLEEVLLCFPFLCKRLDTSTDPKTKIFDKVLKVKIEFTTTLFEFLIFFLEFSIELFFIEGSRLIEEG